jgi:hypothetical protein
MAYFPITPGLPTAKLLESDILAKEQGERLRQ